MSIVLPYSPDRDIQMETLVKRFKLSDEEFQQMKDDMRDIAQRSDYRVSGYRRKLVIDICDRFFNGTGVIDKSFWTNCIAYISEILQYMNIDTHKDDRNIWTKNKKYSGFKGSALLNKQMENNDL